MNNLATIDLAPINIRGGFAVKILHSTVLTRSYISFVALRFLPQFTPNQFYSSAVLGFELFPTTRKGWEVGYRALRIKFPNRFKCFDSDSAVNLQGRLLIHQLKQLENSQCA